MLPEFKKLYWGTSRQSRAMKNYVQRPEMTREQLMNYWGLASQGRIEEISSSIRAKRQGKNINPQWGRIFAEFSLKKPLFLEVKSYFSKDFTSVCPHNCLLERWCGSILDIGTNAQFEELHDVLILVYLFFCGKKIIFHTLIA